MSKKGGLTVLFYPSFDNSEDFTDHYYRMMWYLNPLRERIRRIVVPYEGEAPSVGALPYYLDPTIKQMADESGIANAVELVSSQHTSLLENAARKADVVLIWRTGSGQGNRVLDGPLKPIIMKRKHYFVDHKHERFAGSFYLRLSSEICNNNATVKECREKFRQIPADDFNKIGYIYGTGPSLQAALEMDLSDGTSIVCNTIVKNKELMRKLKPPIITVADPIFHAGCSSYAGDFRRHLIEAMVEFDSYLIVPMRDYALYMTNLDPSLRERIIGVPIVPPNIAPNLRPNLNLYKKFQITPATSIMMLFLIPLAATFFEKTFMLGFDGRPLDQDDYFWKHDPASQLVDRMDDIQAAHPAFFKIDYHDFYLEHCRVVARWLEEAEKQGKLFFSLTPSYIPALKRRQVASCAISTESPGIPTVSIVMPAFNASGSIAEAISSVLSQSLTDWELLVIDDGSTDNTREIVQGLAEVDSRIRLLACKGKGVSDARNTGLDAARGEFIAFLDADDFMYLDALKRRVEALDRNPDWNLVHCVTEIVDANSKKLGWQLGRRREVSFKDMSGNPCHINSLLGRSKIFRPTRFEAGLCGEDWLFLSDILRGGEISHRVDNCSVAYVIRRDSTVLGDYIYYQSKVLEVLDMIYSPVRNNLPATPEFTQGLAWPPKRTAALRRRIGCLTWSLLERRANDVMTVLKGFNNQDFSALSRGEIRNQIIYPAMRFYACRREELPERLQKDNVSISRMMPETGIEKTFPHYAREFKLLMRKASKAKVKSMQVSNTIVGPFKRSDRAHIDESALIAMLLAGQTNTGVMIDVGAMHGSALSPFCRLGWRVFAFEPDPTNRKELEIRFGHNPNLTIDGRAVADRIAENMPFYSSAESPGISSLQPFHKSHEETCTVSTTTIADFVREKDLHHIDYLKIDAESYDLFILKGVPWDSIKPNVIMCEFEDSKTRPLGYTMHDMAHYLTERGYKVLVSEWHPVIRYGIRHDWHRLVPYPCELDNPDATGNLIAFRDQPDLQKIATIARRIVKVDTERIGLRDRGIYQWLVDYLNVHYPPIITIGRFVKWGLATLKNTFFGIGGIVLLVIAGLYIAGALIEAARWYLVGIASALLLLSGGLLAIFYIRSVLNSIISNQRTQVSDINKQVSDINKQVSDIKKEVAQYNESDRLRLERAVSIEKQVEMAELQYDLRDSKPVLFFSATTGPRTLSFVLTAGLIISWALRLSGHRVIHLVCRKGLRRCILGTNRHELNQPMPCEKCYAIKSKIFPRDLRWYLEPKSEAPSALIPLESYSLDELADFAYQGIKVGELCISSVRWILRRHNLDSDPRATRLLREYIRGGMNVVDTLQRLLQQQELHSMVVFNGVFYPEAIARAVALQNGLSVVAYEVSDADQKVFLSHGTAAGGGLITIPEDFQMSATQEAELDEYISQRTRGNVGQPGLWPEIKGIEPDLQAFAGQYKNVVSVFTNVIFDTSQYGANTVFESMFDWLDEIIKLASLHPETLFVVRAHPAEVLPRHESEELVGDWLKEHSYLTIPNVRFISPTDYISSYELLNISRFCLVYNSTIGLEAVVLGIPTVMAAAGRYSGAGVAHAPASRKAYRKLVETFLKNGPPPVEDTVRQRARYCMYQLFFRQGLDFSAFLESPDWILKPIDASALHPDNSPEMNIIYKGIVEGGPFYYPH
jgi:FkbM family methyltransferase